MNFAMQAVLRRLFGKTVKSESAMMPHFGACIGSTATLARTNSPRWSWASLFVALLPLLNFFQANSLRAQGNSPMQKYTAHLIRTSGAISLKPLLSDVMQWLPQAEVSLARGEDVLLISIQDTISAAGLCMHLAPYGFELAALLLNGEAMNNSHPPRNTLPWLEGISADSLNPTAIAVRKAEWIRSNPTEHLPLVIPQSTEHKSE